MSATSPTVAAPRSARRISCAEATLRAMVDAGAETLFNIPGRGIYPLLAELPKVPELAYVTGLHEFPLAAIADGYARARGTAAFLSLYMSTGVLNAASAIFLAQRDRVPMVVTATQAESWAVGADHRAEISDIVESVRPFTKWAWMPPTPQRVPEALRRAYTIAMTPPRGPVFVSIPVDYWGAQVDYLAPPPMEWIEPELTAGAEAIERLATLLAGAESPCLVVGFEAITAGLSDDLQALASLLGCALIAEPEPPTLPAPVTFPLFAGSVAEASAIIEESDLVLHIGVNTYEAFHAQILDGGAPKTHLWLGTDAFELNKVSAVDLAVIGPLEPSGRALCASVRARLEGDGAEAALANRGRRIGQMVADERGPLLASRAEGWEDIPMSVARICAELRDALPPETILVDHSTTAVRLVRENFPVPDGRQYISASGSCQGWGLPATVGVQLASPQIPVVGIVGDGGFMFGVQALWTAVEYELPLLLVVLDNGGWSSMRGSLGRVAPAVVEAGMEMHFGWSVDFAALAGSLGASGVAVDTPEQLRKALSERRPLRGPLVIAARCRRETKTSPSPFVGY